MILCFDIGNSHIFGGALQDDQVILRFRYASRQIGSSDQLGIFLVNVLKENGLDPKAVKHISVCSVVPSLDYTFTSACIKYFKLTPFVLKPGVKTGLKLEVKNPLEIGSDRIANAIGAVSQFRNTHIIIADYGTATTHCAISSDNTFLGGVIAPGMKTAVEALSDATAKLPRVEIIKPNAPLGKSTVNSIQAGVYFGQLGASKYHIEHMSKTLFNDQKPLVIGTGGFSRLFKDEGLFDVILPDLVLQGLRVALEKNL